MANPITWRNVAAPNFGTANLQYNQGGNMITDGLDRLAGVVQGIGQSRQNEAAQMKDYQTQQFMNRIMGQNSLDGFNNFNQQIQNDLAPLGAGQVDTQKVLQALGQRKNTLQDNWTTDTAFNNAQATEAERPYIQAFNDLLGRRDFAGAQSYLDANKGNIRDTGSLLQTLNTQQRSYNEQQKQDNLDWQRDNVGDLTRNILKQVDNPDRVETILKTELSRNGITGDRLSTALKNAIPEWERIHTLNRPARERLDGVAQYNQQALDNFDRETQLGVAGFGNIAADDATQWQSTGNSTSSVISDIMDNVTKTSSWYTDDLDRSDVKNALTEAKSAIIRDNPEIKEFLTGPEADNFLGIALKRAYDVTGNDTGRVLIDKDSDVLKEAIVDQIKNGGELLLALQKQGTYRATRLKDRKRLESESGNALKILESALRKAQEDRL
ncbi:hypothetical protein [Alteromonas sp. RKMC-009]|uniref:hypothetical protein n=1 Tax=Alteromonas sp. RKMC-009 TaxID=2267264 RepID=UPI000E679474|nr:hypothetical protein [Alteromonas sp. RKMC-009]AYA64334.1 hypothetical protein DS731_10170 [Alteromonas sp. RKMC-009]